MTYPQYHTFSKSISLWIFSMSISFDCLHLRDIEKPRWLGLWLCKRGKHAWYLWQIMDKSNDFNSIWQCEKCKAFSDDIGRIWI